MSRKSIRMLKFKLDGINKEDKRLLRYLEDEFRRNYCHYLRVIKKTGILSKAELEKKTTITSKRRNVGYPIRSKLLANTRQCARDSAIESIKIYRSLKDNGLRTDFTQFSDLPINPKLNWMEGYRIDSNGMIRISIRKGVRVYANLKGNDKDVGILNRALNREFRFNSAQVVREGDDYWVHIGVVPNNSDLIKNDKK